MSEATPGTIVGGDFRILHPLQAGGMGAVYIAEQLSTGKQRALKLMHARLVDDAAQRKRFVREARVAAQIDSEHVVEVLAAGVTEATAIPWLAMELLRGCDLSRLVRENGPLTLAQALPIMEQLCHGLGAAHDAGIVHRDLKPQNVFLCRLASSSRPWSVKVLDFGIAKVVADRNQTTAALGSPAWMAPEQTDTSSDMAPAADVWALGLVLFWMLTGRFYWKAMNEQNAGVQAVLREMLFEPLVPPSERAADIDGEVAFPAALDAWFLRCLERGPEDRFPTATVAWHELRAATGDEIAPSHVLPTEVAELAARAAVDLTPDVPARPDPVGPTRATSLPSTRREGSPPEAAPRAPDESTIASAASADSRDDTPSDGAEPGPTLQSHELGVAREAASDGRAGWVKWLLAAAFVAGAGGAVLLSQPEEEEDAASAAVPAPLASALRDAAPRSTAPSPPVSSATTASADPVADLLDRAQTALASTQLDEAERLAGQALQTLGALNGRRPATSAPRASGDRAQTVLARVAISRGQLAGPLPAGAPRGEVSKALDAREPFLVEARLDCTKGETWLAPGEGSCCQIHLATALAEVEAAAKATGVAAKRWTEQVAQALEAAATPPSRCRKAFERLQERGPAPPAPAATSTPRPTAAFSPSRAQAALSAKAAKAKAACRHILGQPVHTFSVTFRPSGHVSVSAPAPDPAGKCIHAVLSRTRMAPYAAASGPKTQSITVSLQ